VQTTGGVDNHTSLPLLRFLQRPLGDVDCFAWCLLVDLGAGLATDLDQLLDRLPGAGGRRRNGD